ncbi:MAG TPA: PIN domain-containing protein [Gaiella sp.]|nr:PIN domain-containing protein [Gaiella sp.]
MSAPEPYGDGALVVFDTSAWNRQRSRPDVVERWRATLDRGTLVVCPIVALELLASARDEDAFRRLDDALATLPQAPVTRSACSAALGVSRELRGERRLPATDYLIAAAAAERGASVLHYDRHFDPLCRVLGIESVWLAEPGTLD